MLCAKVQQAPSRARCSTGYQVHIYCEILQHGRQSLAKIKIKLHGEFLEAVWALGYWKTLQLSPNVLLAQRRVLLPVIRVNTRGEGVEMKHRGRLMSRTAR